GGQRTQHPAAHSDQSNDILPCACLGWRRRCHSPASDAGYSPGLQSAGTRPQRAESIGRYRWSEKQDHLVEDSRCKACAPAREAAPLFQALETVRNRLPTDRLLVPKSRKLDDVHDHLWSSPATPKRLHRDENCESP